MIFKALNTVLPYLVKYLLQTHLISVNLATLYVCALCLSNFTQYNVRRLFACLC